MNLAKTKYTSNAPNSTLGVNSGRTKLLYLHFGEKTERLHDDN